MKAFALKPHRITLAAVIIVSAIAATALLTKPCQAQYPGQRPSAGQYPLAMGQYPGAGQYSPALSQPTAAPHVSLPPGVDKIIANEGNNHLLVIATPSGYEYVRDLVRNITGNLDIIRTKVVSVEASSSDLELAGIYTKNPSSPPTETGAARTLPPGIRRIYATEGANLLFNPTALDLSNPIVSADAATKLIAALQTGNLRPIETLRITTRENTPVDTLLTQRGRQLAGGGTPFTLVPREETDGSLTMQLLQPVSTFVTVKSGQTAVLALPGSKSGEVQLLFMTPTIVPSDARTTR